MDWKPALTYTKREKNGILILLLLCTLLFILPNFYPYILPTEESNYFAFQNEVEQVLSTTAPITSEVTQRSPSSLFYFDPNTANIEELQQLGLSLKTATTLIKYRERVKPFKQASDLGNIYNLTKEDYQRILPFVKFKNPEKKEGIPLANKVQSNKHFSPLQPHIFDPNLIPAKDLLQMGLSEKVTRTWVNFRNKGGRFYQPEDIQKIYGLGSSEYQELLPYIQIPSTTTTSRPVNFSPQKEAKKESRSTISININQATQTEWQKLKGIGPVLSKRIVNFREKLGGFVSIEQVAETYQLPDSTFQKIKVFLKPSPIKRKIQINRIAEEELIKHPYINRKQARVILNYRKHHGPFQGIEDFQKIKALNLASHQKIKPYLSFQ